MEQILNLANYFIVNATELVGFTLPPLIEWLNKNLKTDSEKWWSTIIVCFIVAGLLKANTIIENGWGGLATTFLIIFGESQVIFKIYFKNSMLRQKLNGKENANVVQQTEVSANPVENQ